MCAHCALLELRTAAIITDLLLCASRRPLTLCSIITFYSAIIPPANGKTFLHRHCHTRRKEHRKRGITKRAVYSRRKGEQKEWKRNASLFSRRRPKLPSSPNLQEDHCRVAARTPQAAKLLSSAFRSTFSLQPIISPSSSLFLISLFSSSRLNHCFQFPFERQSCPFRCQVRQKRVFIYG